MGDRMSCTIWKFPFEIAGEFTLDLPEYAEFLSAQIQLGEPCMWFRLDPEAKTFKRTFRVHGTGHSVADGDEITYLATLQTSSGQRQLVWHLFEKTNTN